MKTREQIIEGLEGKTGLDFDTAARLEIINLLLDIRDNTAAPKPAPPVKKAAPKKAPPKKAPAKKGRRK
jgi:hypothetical protein